MKKFTLVVRQDEESIKVSKVIKDDLKSAGFIFDENNPELIICVGGDGTLLYAVHKYINILDTAYLVGIHTGTLGFFTDYTVDELNRFLDDVKKDDPIEIFESNLLEAHLNEQKYYALNEFRIENPLETQEIVIKIDGEYFEKFKGNGLCLSTQAGSTAYNRSINGAIIDSGVSLMQLVEVAGIHDQTHRSLGAPYILGNDRILEFEGDFSNVNFIYDFKNVNLSNCNKVKCMMSKKKVKFIRYRKYSYLDRVRSLY